MIAPIARACFWSPSDAVRKKAMDEYMQKDRHTILDSSVVIPDGLEDCFLLSRVDMVSPIFIIQCWMPVVSSRAAAKTVWSILCHSWSVWLPPSVGALEGRHARDLSEVSAEPTCERTGAHRRPEAKLLPPPHHDSREDGGSQKGKPLFNDVTRIRR